MTNHLMSILKFAPLCKKDLDKKGERRTKYSQNVTATNAVLNVHGG